MLIKLDELFDLNMKDFQLLCSIERPFSKIKIKMMKNALIKILVLQILFM